MGWFGICFDLCVWLDEWDKTSCTSWFTLVEYSIKILNQLVRQNRPNHTVHGQACPLAHIRSPPSRAPLTFRVSPCHAFILPPTDCLAIRHCHLTYQRRRAMPSSCLPPSPPCHQTPSPCLSTLSNTKVSRSRGRAVTAS